MYIYTHIDGAKDVLLQSCGLKHTRFFFKWLFFSIGCTVSEIRPYFNFSDFGDFLKNCCAIWMGLVCATPFETSKKFIFFWIISL